MEHYTFRSTLLIPAPEFAGKDFMWLDTFRGQAPNGSIETVDILVFNAKSKEEIKPILETELKRLQTLEEPKETDTHNMAYLENLLREMEDGSFEHEAPKGLLDALFIAARKRYSAREIIYLSGITGISK